MARVAGHFRVSSWALVLHHKSHAAHRLLFLPAQYIGPIREVVHRNLTRRLEWRCLQRLWRQNRSAYRRLVPPTTTNRFNHASLPDLYQTGSPLLEHWLYGCYPHI